MLSVSGVLRLVCSRPRSSSTSEPVSVRARTTRASAEAVAAEDVEDDVEDGDNDLEDCCERLFTASSGGRDVPSQ